MSMNRPQTVGQLFATNFKAVVFIHTIDFKSMIIYPQISKSYLNCRRGSASAPTSGPVIVQTPAPAPAPAIMVEPLIPAQRALPAPYYRAQQRRNYRAKRSSRSCCSQAPTSDDEFAIG